MLTCTEKLYKDNFGFRIFGCESDKTNIYRFLDKELENDKFSKKLIAVLNAINTNPMFYLHDQKFKHLEGDIWEIKIKLHRIACIWDAKPYNLIAIYAFKKKTQKWPKRDLEQMRREYDKYLHKCNKRLEGGYYGRNKQIQERY